VQAAKVILFMRQDHVRTHLRLNFTLLDTKRDALLLHAHINAHFNSAGERVAI
jgi:hypothetical protein